MAHLVHESVERYAEEVTERVSPLFDELRKETYLSMKRPVMQVGPVEGTFLRMLVNSIGAKRVLDVGTFTGYSALMMASALPEDGVLYTLESNPVHMEVAKRYFSQAGLDPIIVPILGNARDSLRSLEGPFDLIFIDADKPSYPYYYERCLELLRPGGLILIDNMLRRGGVVHPGNELERTIDQLNHRIAQDERVENVLLTVRDGVMLVRKR